MDTYQCVHCGRQIKGLPKWQIRISTNGDYLMPDEVVPPEKDQGWHPIGSECRKIFDGARRIAA